MGKVLREKKEQMKQRAPKGLKQAPKKAHKRKPKRLGMKKAKTKERSRKRTSTPDEACSAPGESSGDAEMNGDTKLSGDTEMQGSGDTQGPAAATGDWLDFFAPQSKTERKKKKKKKGQSTPGKKTAPFVKVIKKSAEAKKEGARTSKLGIKKTIVKNARVVKRVAEKKKKSPAKTHETRV